MAVSDTGDREESCQRHNKPAVPQVTKVSFLSHSTLREPYVSSPGKDSTSTQLLVWYRSKLESLLSTAQRDAAGQMSTTAAGKCDMKRQRWTSIFVMGGLLGSGNKRLEARERLNAFMLKEGPYFPLTSYATFKAHVLPIAESELTADRKLIYQDPKLEEDTKTLLKRLDYWARTWSAAVTVIIPWEISRAVTSFRLRKTFDAEGLIYLNRNVLLLALCIYLPLYPFTSYIGNHLPLISFSEALTMHSGNDQLSLYRKRLLEQRPDLLTPKYGASEMMRFDGVKLPKSQELSLEPDTQAS